MTISQRIFDLLNAKNMTQKEFSHRTGIPQSTISDWKKKNTNPASDKILIICETLGVTPYELLSGVEEEGGRSKEKLCTVIYDDSEEGKMLKILSNLDKNKKARLMGYLEALNHIDR